MLKDLQFAWRTLRAKPVFTAVAVLSLALGIGANTAIFTVVNTVLLDPLPYPDSDRIVNIGRVGGNPDSVPMFVYWRQSDLPFEDLTAYQPNLNMNLNGGDSPELVNATKVSQNYFRLFGAHPILGRTFTASEDRPGGPRALILSYGLWQRLGGDPSILKKTILPGGAPYQVVGVLSPSFQPNPSADAWIPLQADPNSTDQAHFLMVAGRLSKGITLAEARSRMSVAGKLYAQTHPGQLGTDDKLDVTPMRQQITGDIRPALLILLGAVGLVLLIACVNVANLLLVRANGRRREIAIRAAVGAGRKRIVRQLLTESLLLAFAGGAAGLALGSWGVRGLLALAPGDLPRIQELASISALDPRVAGFTFLLAAVTGVLFGLFPALQLSRTELVLNLKESGTRASTGLKQNRSRSLLASLEVAIAVVLLCGAVLLIRSFVAIHTVNTGFDMHNLLTMQIALTGEAYAKSSNVERLAQQFANRAERIPGVESAAFASALPLEGGLDMIFDISGRQVPKGRKFIGDVQWRFVSAHYFDALRIPLLSGRLFREREPRRTIIINQAMARQFWPNSNPVGQSMTLGPVLGPAFEQANVEVIGVVGDVRDRLKFNPPPMMYQMPSQIPDAAMALINGIETSAVLVRTRPGVNPMSVSRAVQQLLITGEKLPVKKVRTMEQVSFDSTARQNFNLLLLNLFAAVAVVLAAVGIYGVMAYSVQQRTQELGIRIALGATSSGIAWMVLRECLTIAALGTAAGLLGAAWITSLLKSMLYGITATDLTSYAAAIALILTIAIAASLAPALRATRIDPLSALRYE